MANIEEIKSVIVEREEQMMQKIAEERMIERENASKIKAYLSKDVALIITGVRRCGKSTLAFMLGHKNFGYVNFEDERLIIEAKELNKILEALYSLKKNVEVIILDEIQNIHGWERFVARLIGSKKIIITGSNARLLSRELATSLTGRHIDFVLFPFSFREFLQYNNFKPNIYKTENIAKTKNLLVEYINKGGFPLAYKLGKIFLIENYKDIIERDVVQRYKIKYVKVLKELAKYLISNIGNEISYNKIKTYFSVNSVHTIKNYVNYLQNSYLIFLIERFSYKLKEQALAPKKVYCIDTGLVNAIGFKFSENKGHLMENVVAIELMRKAAFGTFEIYYWKDWQQREVDFVIKDKNKIVQLIQVTAASSKLEIQEREVISLIEASKELRCNNLLFITDDYYNEERIKNKKITFMPLWRWLIEEKHQNYQ